MHLIKELQLVDPRWALYELADLVVRYGDRVAPRGISTRELLFVTTVIDDLTACLPLDMNRRFNGELAAVETLSLLSGHASKELITAASPRYLEFTGGELSGAYGPRISPQMPAVIEMLRQDRDTRQALVTIWDPWRDLLHAHGDRPCTTQIGFVVRDGRLITNTMMRSQDVYLGLTYDLVMFSQLHLTVANILGVDAGPLVHQVRSLHAYERDLDALSGFTQPGIPRQRLYGLSGTSWPETADRATRLFYDDLPELTGVSDLTELDSLTERWLISQVRRAHAKLDGVARS